MKMKEGISNVAKAGLKAGGLTDADMNKRSDIFDHYKDIDARIVKHDLGKITGRFK